MPRAVYSCYEKLIHLAGIGSVVACRNVKRGRNFGVDSLTPTIEFQILSLFDRGIIPAGGMRACIVDI